MGNAEATARSGQPWRRLYGALLHLYPAGFRAEYGDEMRRVFAERTSIASGAGALALLWIEALLDTLLNAVLAQWDLLRQDLQYTLRTLSRAPGFALTVILVAGLGVGATTAVFTVTDHVLLRRLPFADSERLVKLWENKPGYAQMELSPPNYRDWKAMSTSFEAMAAYRGLSVNLVGQGQPERLDGAAVTADLLPMLGVKPVLGRLFSSEDDREGAPGTLLLSHGLWLTLFGGDAGVVGKKVLLDNKPFDIIGVLPEYFRFPRRDAEIWTAMQFTVRDFEDFEARNNNYLGVVAKLRRGVSLRQSQEEMTLVAAQLAREYPASNENTGATLTLLREDVSRQSRLLLTVLFAAAACVLLIACTNLANLLLVRALARQKEIAVRASLGAGRERLVRQLLTESLALAALGGICGVLAANAALPLLMRLVPSSLPIAEPSIDLRVLLFAVLLTALTGLGFGVVPAVRACGSAGADGLREGSRAGVGGRKERLRAALVILEVTASVVLLVAGGLLIRALWTIQAVDPGFRAEGVLTLRTSLPMPKYQDTAPRKQFYAQVLAEVRKLPGVTRASYISFLPMTLRGGIWPVSIDEQIQTRSENHTASLRFVMPDFFQTLEIPLRAGRDVSEADTRDSPYVAVVSESFVERYWPGEDPLGRRFEFAFKERTVVGVVGDVRVRGLERDSEPQVYLPYQQVDDAWLTWYSPKDLVVRSAAGPEALLPAIRRIIQSADPEQPVSDVRMLADIVEADTASRRAQVRVLGAFAAVAFLLAAVGIHGLLSFSVSQRRQEIGVRLALGAQRFNILVMVLRESVALAGAGVVLGVACGYAAGRSMEALLVGVTPGDAAIFCSAVGLAMGMTVVGSLVPSLRAVRVDPASVIRNE
jgi:predicted permease